MDWEGIARSLNGPEPVKLVLAMILVVAFVFWQRKETEGTMIGYIVVALFLVAREGMYFLFPHPDFYRASDLVLLALLAFVFALPLGRSLLVYACTGISALAGILLWLGSSLGFHLLPSVVYLVAGLGPIGILFFHGTGAAANAGGHALQLIRTMRYSLATASLAYLVAGALLGPGSLWFQTLAVCAFYAALSMIGFAYIDIIRAELVLAVEYYEESVDSLYELFMATGSVIKSGFSLQEVLDGLLEISIDRSSADGGMVLLAEAFEEIVAVRALQGRFAPPFRLPASLPRDEERVAAYMRHARFHLGEGLIGQLAKEGSELFIADADSDPRIPRNGEEEWLRLRSLLVAPLVMKDHVIGLLLLSRGGDEAFSERDFDRIKLLASFGAIAVSDAFTFVEAAERGDIDREAAIAQGIQRTVVPRSLPELPGFQVGVFSNPARGVCSDYYDIIRIKPKRSLVVFGDVAGKGVAAGLVMVMIRGILNLIVHTTGDVSTLLGWVNRGLSGKVDKDHFSTLGLLLVDSATGEMEYASAAGQALLVYRRESGRLETIDSKSIPIGVERMTEYTSQSIRLKPDDILLLHSDGVVEAMDGEGQQLGRENLGNYLLRACDLDAKGIAEALESGIDGFSGRSRRHDDQTVLVIKATS
ncbi:MAG: GAF domain-containing SpoIIE family protein phosphatase [Spirochaetota bacterium]